VYCPNCGAPNDDGQLACSNCGLPLGPSPNAASGSASDGSPESGYQTPPGYEQSPGYGPGPGYGQGPGYQQGPYGTGPTPGGQPQWQGAAWESYGPTYAGFWKRLVAYIIDGIVINIVMTIVGYALGIGYLNRIADVGPGRSAAYSLIDIVVFWLYFAFMESSSQQGTLGKMALGIVVTDLDGRRISFGKATVRHWSKILSTLIFMIGWIMAGFTERKQALHDIIAGTLVVNKR
jgi:uncharacterized RDD family membrane protein YckC